MVKRVALIVTMALAVVLLVVLACPCDVASRASTGTLPYTLVIGDSITYRGQDNLLALRPDWVIDGVPQRSISALGELLREHIAEQGIPETLVIALGTNSNDQWTKDNFREVLSLVPDARVVFVTVWRDPDLYPLATDRMKLISGWMRQFAESRPYTTTAEWRTEAILRPYKLVDGVHPTDPQGEGRWAYLVSQAWSSVHFSGWYR